MDRYRPQALASVVGSQSRSSWAVPVLAQVKLVVHTASPRVPWQVVSSLQMDAPSPKVGQSSGCRQQSPPEQQMPLSQ
jgi:hypothetical protein